METILYLEDDANLRKWNAAQLREKNYIVQDFYRVDQAKEYFAENETKISLVVTDLNMEDNWLESYQNESCGGYLSGWVWLEHFVYTKTPNMPTIIYSAYNDLLKQEKSSALWLKSNIVFVDKGDDEDKGFQGLLSAMAKMLAPKGEYK